jgi:predicted restriction endonuclease
MKVIEQVKARYAHRCAAYTPQGTRCMVHAPLEVHHVDGDHGNNDARNLVPLCRKHHKLFAHARAQEFAEPEMPMVR